MVSWSSVAPSTSIDVELVVPLLLRPRRDRLEACRSAAISSSRFFFACSTLISEVAIRIVTVLSVAGVELDVAGRVAAAARRSMPLAVTGRSNVAYTNIRVGAGGEAAA